MPLLHRRHRRRAAAADTRQRGRFSGLRAGLAGLLLLGSTSAAFAQADIEYDRGPAAELYIRKRPPPPASPTLTAELESMLTEKEAAADEKRREAIELLRAFIDTKPQGEARAEALFKLAELLWEDARVGFIARMDQYERALEACRQDDEGCKERPSEPRIDLDEPAALYRQLLAEFPQFRRADLVLYLVGFAAREQQQYQESLEYFGQVVERYPDSPLYGDAWMMIGEHYFSTGQWPEARAAYANVLARPDSPTYDLALFKTAWADWKLGDPDLAARRFKQVLDLAVEAETSGSAVQRRRRAQLRDEALEYLVVVFTEDRSISAQEVYDFLASIGGTRYSRDVLVRVADAYFGQSEYERAAQTYRFLIDMKPTGIEAAEYQRAVVEAYVAALQPEQVEAEMRLLVENYGPASKWAEQNAKFPTRKARSERLTEAMVRNTAKNYHAEAQAAEKRDKKPDLALYTQAADLYQTYLTAYTEHENAAEVRFLRAEILYFKLGKLEEAGDEYLAVAQQTPVGKYHKDALLKAMDAFEKARPENAGSAGQRELSAADRKFAASVDLYATLFPADPELVGVIFRNGEMFYDYGDYDEAIKRYGLIVTKYPDDQNAGPAGDRILESLAKAEDYENIEEWARKLKTAKAFQSKEQQSRLDRLIVESIGKSGERYAEAGEFEKAASFYLRIPQEFPQHTMAAQAQMNAGVMYEKAKRPQRAGQAYLALAASYPDSKEAPKAAFAAGQLYESVAYFDRAAEAYEVVAETFPRSEQSADALFNAGLLRQSLDQNERAIEHYQTYAKRYRGKADAAEVAFRIGVVYENAERYDDAADAYRRYLKGHARSGRHVVEAHTRVGRSELAAGRLKRAGNEFDAALKVFRRLKGKQRETEKAWAAEARYHQGELIYRRFEAISLDVKPRRLRRTLDSKTALLAKAQDVYLDVVDFGDAQWATAALFRMGRIYEGFAESLRDAPVPQGLSEDEAEMYRQELEMYVIEVEEQAIDLYATGYQKALELGVYNTYTSQIRTALGRLDSIGYPPALEARARVRLGDRVQPPSAVEEVVRDE
ncbi:tetratricopeptide repeat protein [Haliangium ochraceum]|uniref:Tetratricopeptide TPR_2 repeat protein n=1 Tax=Haliangium ochraceum (strain DSM 14365 / JCM 11303 / SMP-2) TaxID=502025 RepID=D0LI81_HALO1|nr:tetratricopeptide repeat protein [Haliangium ochraceum]ACY16460.1 Tetratricopeptide TPR_2 repeat protein [Haliangium ochraceum DSM 14365]